MYMNRKGIKFGVKDTFSLDSTLSPIILSALKKFKEVITDPSRNHIVGVPNSIMREVFPDAGVYGYSDEQLEEGTRKWLEIIDKMIYSFDRRNEPNILMYNFKINLGYEVVDSDKVKSNTNINNEAEYQRYKNDETLYWKKVEEGHLLFGKYFHTLWW